MKAKRILASVLSVALLLQLSPLGVLALDEGLPQTPQVSTVQENLDPAPTEEPALVAEPTPTAESTPAAVPTPTAAPTTEPTAEPTATPAPEETAAPDAAAAPAPEPSAEPTAAPDPAAEVQAMIDALPDEVTEDNAAAVEQALTDIDDAKESLTDDELAGLDLTRYDAAANALLALWGEAATDEVETLDESGTKPNLVDGWYQITNENELRWFAETVNGGQTNISAILVNGITLDKSTQWTPIGTKTKPFTGTFDGGGNTITGLYFNDPKAENVGLFGYIGKNGTVKNVTVADSYVSGYQYVGGICGYNNCGTVEDCTSDCTVRGTYYIGGICGANGDQNSRLDSGLGYVRNCHNTGTVTGTGFHAGGVCGRNYGKLQNCHNTGTVTGGSYYTAGVCGYNGYNSDGTSIVEKSYNAGNVSGGTSVGGVCGYNNSNVKESYNIGTVTSTTGKNVAGVCGENATSAHVQDCYYLDTSETHAGGGISKTLAEFNSGEVAYLLQKAINDAADKAGTTAEQVWGQNIGTDPYPVLGGKTVYYNDTNKYHNHDDNTECEGCAPKPTTETDAEGKTWYIITTPDELKWFAKWVNGGHTDANAKLANSITLNENVLGELNGTAHDPWTPIGTSSQPFTGTFDGKGHTISGLYINDPSKNNVGLFGCVGNPGTVQNVTLADSYVRGNEFVGGICGWNNGGTLQNCHNAGTVSGTTNVGGVCGKNYSGTVDGCYNSGTVSAGFYVGGVCGLINNGSTLEKSYNTGKVSCTNDHVGGVCGWNDASTVQGCYNTGTVSGGESVGGVCGENSGGGTVQECYNTVTVSGTRNVGGVCGMNSRRGTVQGCYNTGKVSGNSYFGGVCGFNDGRVTVEKCYYLVGTSENAVGNRGDDINCKSKTETEFKNGAVAYRLQSDLNITTQVWGQRIGMDKTPVLSSDTKYKVYKTAAGSPCPGYSNTQGETRNHNYVNGVCSNCGEWEEAKDVDGYYEIHNQGQLRWFADQVNNHNQPNINALLTANITMDGTEWTPIGTDTIPFTGTFDGDGHTISKLTCTDTNKDHVGLVGYAIDAAIQNVTVQGATLNGRDYIGSVCGYLLGGTITNCHAVETVIGKTGREAQSKYRGGIVGYIISNTNVTGCTNSGTVSGLNFLGGIVGQANRATVQRCFNSGAVTGNSSPIGGIVGLANNATVQDCGNNGTVTRADSSGDCGGIAGSTNTSSIQNCYNAYRTIAYPICASPSSDTTFLNCYYLADNPGTDPSAKTEAQFNSGEVAYLLQNGERTDTTTTVWGQTLTGGSQQAFPVLNGDKVYQTTPCTAGYSNTAQQTLDHNYTEDGVCSRCGEWQEAKQAADGYYEIHNQGQLRWFADQVNNNGKTDINARLMNDITMDGTEWTPIGEYFAGKRFTGTFDGDGHTISGLTCTKPDADHVGLVGYAVGATIQNVTVQKSSFNGDTYIGAVCGYIVGGKITGCTNSDTVNVRGNNYLGGIAAHADSTTVQRCFNSGTVTGNYPTGGIVGFANNATVQDCGNTGAVKSPNGNEYCGGIAGSTNNTSSIQNCYNAYRTIVHPICASPSQETTLLNCYYLADNPGTDPSAKTEAQFNSGEVAYLLQNGRTDAVWGQKIGTDDYPKLGGDKVYQSTPCPTDYSNGESKIKDHNIGTDGYCTVCKELCIAYTVTIPATVELGNAASATATISAENVTLPTDKTLQVIINGPFTATLVGKTDVTAQYTIQKDGTALESGDPVLTAQNGESPKIPLTFVKPDAAPYAGSYTGTVTFTVSVGDTTPTP